VIPAPFEYVRADSAEEAVALLARHGEDAKLLAGGHSLIPLMKLRLAAPALLVDLGRVKELSYITDAGDEVRIGALTRHHEVFSSGLLRESLPIVAHVAGLVGSPQVRHRGTIGGSLAHADPASDLPAVVLALDGSLVARGPSGERVIAAREFFRGFLETALRPDEVLTEVRLPKLAELAELAKLPKLGEPPKADAAGWSYQKFNRRAQDWAIVGVAVARRAGGGGSALGEGVGVALVNMASTPVRATAVESALAEGASARDAAAHAAEGLDPPADLNASSEFRAHLARVLVRRGLEEAGL